MKKLITLLLSLTLILSVSALSSCDGGECTAHKDTDGDGACDVCSASVETESDETSAEESEESTEAPAEDTEYRILVSLDDGSAATGVSFTLTGKAGEHSLTSGTDGAVAARLSLGKYAVSFDYDTLPAGCIPETTEITVGEDTEEIVLTLIDNTPNGSLAKPFFISEDVTPLSLTAGTETHYVYRGAATRRIVIPSADVTVTYAGQTYTAVDGTVTVDLLPVIGEVTRFSVRNVSAETVEVEMTLASPLGTMENPIPLTESTASVNVPAGGAIYYLWTAQKSGVLLVSSQSATNNISMTNTVTYAVSAMTAGAAGEYLAVSVGDSIVIAVSSTKADADDVVDLTLSCYAATAEEPLPVIKSTVDLSFPANASLTFSVPTGKALRITDDGVSLTVGETVYTPDESGNVSVTLAGDVETVSVTVKNTKDTTNGITVVIE